MICAAAWPHDLSSPSSSLRNLDGFITRAFEMGRLTAQANWHAGAAYQERTSRAATERYD
jgi:hypothetical protein